ncbi:poly(A)-binding protein binding protein [Friedmanniomyces endolithicus]|nr:poly(A)-binding protein binding protein [Friedmanniomyces endolithicus]
MGHFAWSVAWSDVSLHIGFIIDPRYWLPGRFTYGPWPRSARQGSRLAVQSARDTVQNKLLFFLPSPWPERYPAWEEVLTLNPQTGEWEESRVKSVLINLYGASVAAGVGDVGKMREFEELAEKESQIARRFWVDEEVVRRVRELEGEVQAVEGLQGNSEGKLRRVKSREGLGEMSGSGVGEHHCEKEFASMEKTKKPKKKRKAVLPPARLPESTLRSAIDMPSQAPDLELVDLDVGAPKDNAKTCWNAANLPSPVQNPKRVPWKPAADLVTTPRGSKCASTGSQTHAASPTTQDRQAGDLLLEAMGTPDTSERKRGKSPVPDVASAECMHSDNDHGDLPETDETTANSSFSQTQLSRLARKVKKVRHQENKRRAKAESLSQEDSARRLRVWERMGDGAAVCCSSKREGAADIPLAVLSGGRFFEQANPEAPPVQQPGADAARYTFPSERASVNRSGHGTEPPSEAHLLLQSSIGTIPPAYRPTEIASEDDSQAAAAEKKTEDFWNALVQQVAEHAQERKVQATIICDSSPASPPPSQAATDLVGVRQAEQWALHRSKEAEFARSTWQPCNVCARWSNEVLTCPHADLPGVDAMSAGVMETRRSPLTEAQESEPDRMPKRAHKAGPTEAIEHRNLDEGSQRLSDRLVTEQALRKIEPAHHELAQPPDETESAIDQLLPFEQPLHQPRRATVPPSGQPRPLWTLTVAEQTPNKTEKAQYEHVPAEVTFNEPRRATVPPSDPPPPELALTGADYTAHVEQAQGEVVPSDWLTREMNAHFPYWAGSFPRGWTPCQSCGWLSDRPKRCTHEGRRLWEEEYKNKPARKQLWWPKVPQDEDTVAPEHPAQIKSNAREQLELFPGFDGSAYPSFQMQRWDDRPMGLMPPQSNFQPWRRPYAHFHEQLELFPVFNGSAYPSIHMQRWDDRSMGLLPPETNFQPWRRPYAHVHEQPAASRPHPTLSERKRAARMVDSAMAIARGACVAFTTTPPPRKYEGTIWMLEPVTGRLGLRMGEDDTAADPGVSLAGFSMSEIHTLAFRTVGARGMTSDTWSIPLAKLPGAAERMTAWLQWLHGVWSKGLTPLSPPASRLPTPPSLLLTEVAGSNHSDSSRTPSPQTVRCDSIFFDKGQRLPIEGDSCKSIDGAFNPVKRMLNETTPPADGDAFAANGGMPPVSDAPLTWPSGGLEGAFAGS